MTSFIDISCDLGEAVTAEEIAIEEQLWAMISSANVACGGHVGDRESMERAVALAGRYGVTLGAHPSYPDRENFGRKTIPIEENALRSSLRTQLDDLASIARGRSIVLERVKPHGALYNDAHRDRELANIVVGVVREFHGVRIVCSASSEMARAAAEAGVGVVREAFADRRYMPDSSLMPRSNGASLLEDEAEAARQALLLAQRGRVVAADGREIEVVFDTLCIHGDMPGAVARLRRIREVLEAHGFSAGRSGELER